MRSSLAGVEMGLAVAGVPHAKGGAQVALDYLAECAKTPALRVAA